MGCISTPKQPVGPPPPPPALVGVAHFIGTPLTGPMPATAVPIDVKGALGVSVTFVAMRTMPSGPAQSLGSAARFIAVERGGVPVLPTARLTQSSRLASVDDAGQYVQSLESKPNDAITLAAVHGALPAGVTVAFDAGERIEPPPIVAGQVVRRSVKVELFRAAGPDAAKVPLQVALTIEDLVAPPKSNDSTNEPPGTADLSKGQKNPPAPPAPPPAPSVLQRELAIFDRPAAAHDQFALLVPFQFGESWSHALAIVVEIAPGSADAGHQAALAACAEDLSTAAALASTRPYQTPLDNPDWPSFASALESMRQPERARSALVFLSSETGANVCEDVALVAEPAALNALVQGISTKLSAAAGVRTREALAWALDSAAYDLMAQQLSTGKLAPELAATLTLHAGEAGRHPGSVEEALKAVSTAQDFEVRLTAENYIFLEDSSPASRVRAFDWLRAHDRAPANYDPLGPPRQRRAALDKALNPTPSPTAAPATAGGAP